MSTRRTFLKQAAGASAALTVPGGLFAERSATGAAATGGRRIYEVGAVYLYYSWTEEAQIVKDLETIAGTGINAINPYPSFLLKYGNPEPDFTKMDVILKISERLGLRVMPTLYESRLIVDYAASNWPDRFPPTVAADQRQAMLPLADPKILDLVDHYARVKVQYFKDRPCVVAYNIWDEPHLMGFSLEAGVGKDDPEFDRWFQKWGLKKYGSAAAWYAQWNDPHLNQEYQNFDRPLFYWHAVGYILRHINQLVKSLDPVHPTRTHNVGSMVVSQGTNIFTQDDWTLSRFTDQFGLSYYPDIPARNVENDPKLLKEEKALWDTPWTTSLELTTAHDAAGGKPFVMPEVQTGPQTGFTRYGAEPGVIFDYSRIHMLSWQMAAHDAKGMYFWKWCPHMDEWQAFGRGLVAADGSLTGRAKAAGDAARALNADPNLFLDSRPEPPQVAVVFDIVGDLKAVAQGRGWGSFPSRNLIGIYRELWGDQVRINVLDGRQLSAEKLKPYKLVIFPFYLCLRKNVADAITAYVTGGGTVLADARFGIVNPLDHGYPVNPGLGMAKLFGARRHGLVAGYSPWKINVTHPAGLLRGATLPNHLGGRVFREDLRLEKGSEGQVAAVFEETGTPAIVVRRTGKGQTILLGFSLGIPLLEDHDPGTIELLRAVWRSAGVEPPIQISSSHGPVEAVVHSRGRADERLVYVLNWGTQPADVKAQLPGAGQGQPSGKDMVSGQTVPVGRNNDALTFNLKLPPGHAAAVLVHM